MLNEKKYTYDELFELYTKQSRRLDTIIKRSDRQTQALLEMGQKFEKMAYYDQMTNVHNRRYFFDIVDEIISNAKNNSEHLCLAVIDIDKFKIINDTYGHDVGDKVIISLANEIKKILRTDDIFARFGGEEFILLFPNTSLHKAKDIAEKIRMQIEKCLPHEDIQYTISGGISQFNLNSKNTVDDAIKKADDGLYKSKRNGRNQIHAIEN